MQLFNFIKNHKVITALIIALIILLPIFIVHCLFKSSSPYEYVWAEWSAGELLGYVGSVLGALATIIAVILTIQFSISNQKEERKLSIKPYLQTKYHPTYKSDFTNKDENKTVFITYSHDEAESINSSLAVPYLLSAGGNISTEKAILDNLKFIKENHVIYYSLLNVGAGNAVKIRFTIDGKLVMPDFSLAVNDKHDFVIILKATLLKNSKERVIRFVFEYEDVASMSRYEQHENIVFYKETKDDGLNTRQGLNDLITLPQEKGE